MDRKRKALGFDISTSSTRDISFLSELINKSKTFKIGINTYVAAQKSYKTKRNVMSDVVDDVSVTVGFDEKANSNVSAEFNFDDYALVDCGDASYYAPD